MTGFVDMRRVGWCAAFVFVTAMMGDSHAYAAGSDPETTKQMQEQFRRGKKRFNRGDYAGALIYFDRLYQSSEKPELLWSIAQCHRHLAHHFEAVQAFKRFVFAMHKAHAENPDKPLSPHVEAAEKHILDLEELMDRAKKDPDAEALAAPPPLPPVLAAKPPPATKKKPVYKKWWFWALVGVMVAGTTAAIVATSSSSSGGCRDVGVEPCWGVR